MKDIFSIKNIVGIKVSHKNLRLLEKFRKDYPNLIIHIGSDEILTTALNYGVDGAVGSTYNILPQEFLNLFYNYNLGQKDTANAIQEICNEFILTLCACGGTPAVKYILKLQGIDCGESRKPFSSLSNSDKELLKKAYLEFQQQYSKVIKASVKAI